MFWGGIPTSEFKLFGLSHIIVIVIVIGVALLIYRNRKRIGISKYEKHFRVIIALLLIIQSIIYQAWLISTGTWSIETSLPFSICECAAFLCIYMLLTKSKQVFEIVYFAGTVISFLVVLSPALSFNFPHIRFIEFFMEHGLIVIAPLYMAFVHGFRPTWKSPLKTVLVMNCCAPIIIGLNYVTKGNYWFIANLPEQQTILNIFGGYPWYILVAEIVGIMIFYLAYLPFGLTKRKDQVSPIPDEKGDSR